MRKEAIKQIKKHFNVNEENILNLKRFNKGMSNYTFYFELNSKKYVIRLKGLKAENFVSYSNEYEVLKTIDKFNITGKLIYYNKNTGIKISEYVDGSSIKVLTNSFVTTLKKLHNIKSNKIENYNLIERLNKYENYNKKENINNKYFEMKNWWIKTYENHFKQHNKVLCHNDLQNINIISNDNTYLIDFEYASYNDPLYDIASFELDSYKLYELYFNKKLTKKAKSQIIFYKVYQSLQWYQVALYKHEIGFSKLTNYDFLKLTNFFINDAYNNYLKIKEFNFNEH